MSSDNWNDIYQTEWQNQLHHGVEDKTMTDKNANTEICKEFCPNCEADTPCTHEAELYVCEFCGEDFAKYIVSRNCNVSDVSTTQDVLMDIKKDLSDAEIEELGAQEAEKRGEK